MEIEFEKTLNLQSKLRAVEHPEAILYDQIRDYQPDLFKLVLKYEHITHHDESIKQVYVQYLSYVWRRQVESLFEKLDSSQEIDCGWVESLFTRAQRVEQVDERIVAKLAAFKAHYLEKCKLV